MPHDATHAPSTSGSGYWYEDGAARPTSVDVLNLLRRYREAERTMRQRTRSSMRMGETDLIALRYLLEGQRSGHLLRQRDLARKLGISYPAASALVDRLVRDGWARRLPHADDRRSVALEPTPGADQQVRETLGAMHRRMIDAVDALPEHELAAVAHFLTMITAAVNTEDHVEQGGPATHEGSGTPEG